MRDGWLGDVDPLCREGKGAGSGHCYKGFEQLGVHGPECIEFHFGIKSIKNMNLFYPSDAFMIAGILRRGLKHGR